MTLIYSSDQGLIDNKLKEILKKDFSKYQIVTYISPNQLIDLLHANSMFSESNEKLYIIKNCIFLTEENEAKISLDLFAALEQNTNLNVFLTIESDKVLNKNQLVSSFLNKIEIIKIPKLDMKEFKKLILDSFKKYQINLSAEAINILLTRIPLNVGILNRELEKLFLFSPNEINIDLIEDLITEYGNAPIFKLVEHILTKNHSASLKLFDQLISNHYTSLELLQIMSGQALKMIIVRWSINNGFSEEDIVKNLEISKYQLIQIKKILNLVGNKQLENFFNGILSIDIKLKRLNMDSNILRFFVSKGSC